MAAATLALALAIGGLAFAGSALATEPECVPRNAYTEIITPATPGSAAVYETITITEAGWQRYSYNGNWDSEEAPAFPSDNWQPNVAGDPQGIGVAGAYFRSHGNEGNGDWFYLEAISAVTEQHLVSAEVPAMLAVTIDHAAVICEPPVVIPPVVIEPPIVVVPPVLPPVVIPPVEQPVVTPPPAVTPPAITPSTPVTPLPPQPAATVVKTELPETLAFTGASVLTQGIMIAALFALGLGSILLLTTAIALKRRNRATK